MEEKKKIKLSTALLIISIFIIIIICIYFFVFSNKNTTNQIDTPSDEFDSSSTAYTNNIENNTSNNNNTLENNSSKVSSNNTKNAKSETVKNNMPQLAGEFSDIQSITKEYRDNQNIKNYKDFNYDLDSDGTVDKITLKHTLNGNEDNYLLEYNGKSIYEHWEGFGSAGIVDLDNTDKYLDIWVYDDGPSDDPVYYFYRKTGNQITKMGEFRVDTSFLCDGKGQVLAAGREILSVSPQIFNKYYTIENNTFKEHNLDFSYNPNYEYTSKDAFFTTNLENLNNFEKDNSVTDSNTDSLIALGKKYNINKLSENTKFKIIEFVKNESIYPSIDLKVTLSDGTTGYLIHPYGRFYIYD